MTTREQQIAELQRIARATAEEAQIAELQRIARATARGADRRAAAHRARERARRGSIESGMIRVPLMSPRQDRCERYRAQHKR